MQLKTLFCRCVTIFCNRKSFRALAQWLLSEIRLFNIINTLGADVLATQVSSASAAPNDFAWKVAVPTSSVNLIWSFWLLRSFDFLLLLLLLLAWISCGTNNGVVGDLILPDAHVTSLLCFKCNILYQVSQHTHTHICIFFSLSMNRQTKTMYNVYKGLSSKFITLVETQCISVNISQMFIQHQHFSYRDLGNGVIHQHVEAELRIASVDWVSIGSCPMVGAKLHYCQLYTPGSQISKTLTAFTWQQTPFSTNQNTGVRFTNHFPALTHWGRDEMNNISQTTFLKVSVSSMKMFEFRLKFHWNLFPRVQLTIVQHWSR